MVFNNEIGLNIVNVICAFSHPYFASCGTAPPVTADTPQIHGDWLLG